MNNIEQIEKAILDGINEKNGHHTQKVDLENISILADSFIITSAPNERQVKAILNEIEDKTAQLGVNPKRVDGKNNGRWVVLDYGDIIVHIFHEDDREFYNIEKLWNEGANIIEIEED